MVIHLFNIKNIFRIFLQETYELYDYWWVFNNDLSIFNTNNFYWWGTLIRARSNTDYALLNTPIPLPNEFEIEYSLRKTGTASNWSMLVLGESGSGQSSGHNERNWDIGKLNSSAMHFRDESNGGTIVQSASDNMGGDTTYSAKITYQNGTLSLTYNNVTISTSNITVDFDYLLGIGIGSYGLIGEFKSQGIIKP